MLRFGRYQVAEKRGARFLKLAAEARSRITEISPLDAVAGAARCLLWRRQSFRALSREPGYTNVKSIAGWLQAWIDADFPNLRTSQPMED